ncbi:hypothetical protein OsJ_11829 [Oryza sativa Japonica Group]|uniref:Uncharacterized protein n=1 Tax=Oryza sativa subsp. japonica TaxID=39947 RepID=B9F9V3_ORYSJ|nr:hypothetical protein OsJ_11829 [Oryza sativa Japonica Group]
MALHVATVRAGMPSNTARASSTRPALASATIALLHATASNASHRASSAIASSAAPRDAYMAITDFRTYASPPRPSLTTMPLNPGPVAYSSKARVRREQRRERAPLGRRRRPEHVDEQRHGRAGPRAVGQRAYGGVPHERVGPRVVPDEAGGVGGVASVAGTEGDGAAGGDGVPGEAGLDERGVELAEVRHGGALRVQEGFRILVKIESAIILQKWCSQDSACLQQSLSALGVACQESQKPAFASAQILRTFKPSVPRLASRPSSPAVTERSGIRVLRQRYLDKFRNRMFMSLHWK